MAPPEVAQRQPAATNVNADTDSSGRGSEAQSDGRRNEAEVIPPRPPTAATAADDRPGIAALFFSSKGELVSAIVAGVFLAGGFVGQHMLASHGGDVWGPRCIWISLALGMVHGGRAAIDALRAGEFNIDVLMALGAALAAWIGHPDEGALLLFLFVLSGALEDLAMARTKREVEALTKLMPTLAIVERAGAWVEVEPGTLVASEKLKIRPGDRVPTDARVVSGRSSMDQSAITGESMPRDVKTGDELYAGTINVGDTIEALVTRPASESSLQKILNLVTQAREQREPVQRAVDAISQPYAIGVVAISLAVLVVWTLILSRAWQDSLYAAITLLIVASPCALVIATPTATLSAIARAARAGVLFKGGQSIDQLASVGAVCFDKTGTLTIGRPRVYEVHPVAWSDSEQLIAMAAALERDSTHPIAAAIREAAAQRGIVPATLTDVGHTTGRGMAARYHGCPVRLGSYKFTEELIPVCFRNRVKDVLEKIQVRGHLGVVVAHSCVEHDGGGQAAVIIMSDTVRPGANKLVERLHALGIRPVRMLTGDNHKTAEHVAAQLKLDQFDAELLPQDKVNAVTAMKAQRGKERLRSEGSAVSLGSLARLWKSKTDGVAVIGDGVNDAPALAAADVAIGIGSIGSDAALESADIVLLSDDLSVVPWAVDLARRARRTVKVNLVFALSIIAAMGAATIVGSLVNRPLPLSVGVVAHEGGTLLVVFNSLRLLLMRSPQS